MVGSSPQYLYCSEPHWLEDYPMFEISAFQLATIASLLRINKREHFLSTRGGKTAALPTCRRSVDRILRIEFNIEFNAAKQVSVLVQLGRNLGHTHLCLRLDVTLHHNVGRRLL